LGDTPWRRAKGAHCRSEEYKGSLPYKRATLPGVMNALSWK
jgi:hypothetical protein